MIKNDRQLSLSMNRLEQAEQHLERLRKKYTDAEELDFYSEGTRDQIETIRREISDYELAKSAAIDSLLEVWSARGAVTPTRKDQLSLGELITLLRISRGLTQQQLAHRLGMHQPNIARYEQRGYRGYTIESLSRLFGELGVQFSLEPTGQRKAG